MPDDCRPHPPACPPVARFVSIDHHFERFRGAFGREGRGLARFDFAFGDETALTPLLVRSRKFSFLRGAWKELAMVIPGLPRLPRAAATRSPTAVPACEIMTAPPSPASEKSEPSSALI